MYITFKILFSKKKKSVFPLFYLPSADFVHHTFQILIAYLMYHFMVHFPIPAAHFKLLIC